MVAMIGSSADDCRTVVPGCVCSLTNRYDIPQLLTETVEYAMEAISHAGTVLAVLSKEGIAIAAEKVRRVMSNQCLDRPLTDH